MLLSDNDKRRHNTESRRPTAENGSKKMNLPVSVFRDYLVRSYEYLCHPYLRGIINTPLFWILAATFVYVTFRTGRGSYRTCHHF